MDPLQQPVMYFDWSVNKMKTIKATNNFRWARLQMGELKMHMVGALQIAGTNQCQILQQAWQCLEDGTIEWKFIDMADLNT